MAHAEDVVCLQVGLDFRAAAESEVVCSGQEHGTDAEGEKGRVQLRRSYVNGSQLKGLPQDATHWGQTLARRSAHRQRKGKVQGRVLFSLLQWRRECCGKNVQSLLNIDPITEQNRGL